MQGPGSAARWWETSLEEAKGSHSRAKQTAFTKPNCWRSWWTQSLAAHCLDISRWVEQKYRFRVWREGAPQLQQKSFLSLKWPYFGENQSNPVHLRNKHIPAHAVRAGLVWTRCLQRVYFTKYVLGRQGFFPTVKLAGGKRRPFHLIPFLSHFPEKFSRRRGIYLLPLKILDWYSVLYNPCICLNLNLSSYESNKIKTSISWSY